MKANIVCVVALVGGMGVAADAAANGVAGGAAGNRGLSPIILMATSPGADGWIEADQTRGEGKTTVDWLNAYNAPHWVQLFKSTPGGAYPYATSNPGLLGWENKQRGDNPSTTAPTNIELFGTSWMYDLMAAKQYAPDALRQTNSWFNGATDANYGFTPKWNGPQYINGTRVTGQHATHDLGMAFDLGVSNYIDKNTHQTFPSDPGNTTQILAALDAAMQANTNGWNLTNAVDLSGKLVAINAAPATPTSPARTADNQVAALRDFLSLYALTQADGQAGLTGHVVNTTVANLFGSMISGAHIGGQTYTDSNDVVHNQNPYPSINAILKDLGIYSTPVQDHQNHFHIYLKPPTLQEIDSVANRNLMADVAGTDSVAALDNTNPQPLLDYTQTLIEGEELMFIMDVPAVPAQETPIVLAQAATPGASANPQPDYILNTCSETESTGDPSSAMRTVDPAGMLAVYMQNHNNRTVDMAMLAAIKTTLLQDTSHGKITSVVDNTGRPWYAYDPTPNYIGNDRAVFQAEFEGKVYKIVVELHVFRTVNENNPTCQDPQLIKVTKPSSGASGSGAGYDLSSVSVTFADLAGAAVGQTNTNGITLDTNASGYGWFIDTTPADNSEFLPTSNPNEWVAKEGSAAYGKMDMLSVLLHEYGHALGIDHSADSHDYMATTLTAGVRRMPSADELALMQQLVGQVKAGLTESTALSPSPSPASGRGEFPGFPTLPLGANFIGFLGLLRSSRYGGASIAPDASTLVTKYAVAANATLTNGSLNAADGWSTQGSVDIGNGMAVMNEVSASQTRLSQVFMVNERDRFLSFTLAGTALDNLTGAPDDAFEVALLDASTGASLLGGTGLTRSDAFLNLQADGTQYAATCVTCINNADGSRSTSSASARTAATSLCVDVRLSGLPQLRDEAATMLEDGALAFNPFAQVDNAALLMLGSHVVVDSNIATASLNVTAVNDAPVAADAALALAMR